MLQNEYVLVKIGDDTIENEPKCANLLLIIILILYLVKKGMLEKKEMDTCEKRN